MKYLILILLTSCVSVWPQQCEWSWRGETHCQCKEVKFRVKERKRVFLDCDGQQLPLEVSGTGVSVEGKQ